MEELRKLLREALPQTIGGLAVVAIVAIAGALNPGVGIWAVVLATVGVLLVGCAYLAYRLYQRVHPPTTVIILIANIDGPEPQRYHVTDKMLNNLRAALQPYQDVQVEALGRAITEAEGSTVARAEGEKRKAAIVIWGWYGATAEAVPLSVHFEVLRPPKYLPELGPAAKGQVQVMAVAQLESFTLQTRLSVEMTYLGLFTVGWPATRRKIGMELSSGSAML